jgi:hypothetical protein
MEVRSVGGDETALHVQVTTERAPDGILDTASASVYLYPERRVICAVCNEVCVGFVLK